MSDRNIKVTIDPMGNPKIEAIGFNGQGCADATAAIEKALAGSEGQSTRVMKPEWFNTEDAQNQEHVRGW